jgi:hypothetical protein
MKHNICDHMKDNVCFDHHVFLVPPTYPPSLSTQLRWLTGDWGLEVPSQMTVNCCGLCLNSELSKKDISNVSSVDMYNIIKLPLVGMQLPEKYKDNFDVSSEGPCVLVCVWTTWQRYLKHCVSSVGSILQ